MRLIEVCDAEIRAVAISPDSRFVAASAKGVLAVYHWVTGEKVIPRQSVGFVEQIAFAPDSQWVIFGEAGGSLRVHRLGSPTQIPSGPPAGVAGGVAVSPNGKVLVASTKWNPNQARLLRWELPAARPIIGFDDWPSFRRLAFSPDGQFIAGISATEFELRYAVSGGFDHRYRRPEDRPIGSSGFVSFTRDSGTCAFGWDGEFHVLDILGTSRPLRGTEAPSRKVKPALGSPWQTMREVTDFGAPFRDAAFTGSGYHFATLEQPGRWKRWEPFTAKWETILDEGANGTGVLKLWDVQTWELVREYDWNCGPLTCLAFTTDGLAGVCGTADGRLVQFDVDE